MARHSTPSSRTTKRHLGIENLEERCVPAAVLTANLDSQGILRIEGTPNNDTITLTHSITSVRGLTISNISLNNGLKKFNVAAVRRIEIDGLAGNDTINVAALTNHYWSPINSPYPVRIHGGIGNDTIYGSKHADALFGDSGNDRLEGRDGDDFLDGGLNNDSLYGGNHNDRLYGDLGDDRLEGGNNNDIQYGGPGSDTIIDNSGTNTKNAGNDLMDGLIKDAALRSLTRFSYVNSSIDRTEMLDIYQQIRKDNTVSSLEFQDLATMNIGLSMPSHVKNLATKVSTGDRANVTFNGATLGNLRAGSTGSHLQKLVEKWFLGRELPLARKEFGGRMVTSNYTFNSKALYVNDIHFEDVQQRQIGDCYFLASLASAARQNPDLIRNMIIDNGDDTYSVRFFRNGKADWVTVDRFLPTDARFSAKADVEAWVALIEKAYVLVRQSWDGSSRPAYTNIESGLPDQGIRDITGRSTELWAMGLTGGLAKQGIIDAFRNKQLVTFGTSFNSLNPQIVPMHVYVLTGYNAARDEFTIYNPWGPNGGMLADGTHMPGSLTLKWDALCWAVVSAAWTK